MPKLILLRHGESVWNAENRFTGWTDVDLSPTGVEQAVQAGRTLKAANFAIHWTCTSVLKRAIHTLWLVLEEMDMLWLPVDRSWRLNERHYGALQGLNKAETAHKFGDEQVHIWRRSYAVPPPALSPDDERFPGKDPRYRDLSPADIPLTESLKDTLVRVMPYWEHSILPRIQAQENVLVAAHGNSLRALVKHLDQISDQEIVDLNIPTGVPLIYEMAADGSALHHHYLDSNS